MNEERVKSWNLSGVCSAGEHTGCARRFASTTVDASVRIRCECPCHQKPSRKR